MNRKLYHTFIIYTTLLLAGIGKVAAQTPHGFVQQENVKVPGVTTDVALYSLPVTQKQTTRVYTDGFGRTLQSIAVQASPAQRDLIQPMAYDNLGRQAISYLPYAGQATDTSGSYRSTAISSAQPNFYNQTSQYLVATDANPYAQQVFENSPLQRVLQAGMAGNGFQPTSGQHYKTVSYRFNSSATDGNILAWNFDGTFTAGTYYANNTLAVTDGKDEDNTETLSFVDAAGRTILKRQVLASGNLDTYYVYNYAGMLSYTIPPLAVNKLAANSYNLTTAPLINLVFHYVYDNMGRLVEKTVPAQSKVLTIYDPYNRPVLVQDSNMRINNQWNYIKYDIKGRVVSQGIYGDATHIGRAAMQTWVSANYGTNWYESRSTVLSTGYYTNVVFPTSSTFALAYAYYDDYDIDMDGTPNFSYSAQGLPGEGTATTAAVKDMPTMTLMFDIGPGIVAGTWMTKATFYDKRGNPIQTQSNNHLNFTNILTLPDTKTTVPDFTGVPQISKVVKVTGTVMPITITVQTSFAYDHRNRITSVSQAYNGGTSTQVAAYSYNELGQVIKKGLGQVSGSTYLQNVDMRYNIRGQLLSINNSKLSNDAGVTSSDANDVFGLQLLYDKTDANLGNTAYYNGKVSAVKWMSKDGSGTSSYERAFRYYYDALNRDTAAIYAERPTASTGAFTTTHGWDEDRISYDQNGNILSLYRNSATQGAGTHTGIDNLAYTYSSTNPNQLQSVTDGTTASYTGAGFRNLTGGTGNYTYDGNGNLTSDPYKGFAGISHNVLNRTERIYFSSSANRYIDYSYNMDGTLLRKRQYDNVGGTATLQATTDYIDGFVYLNGTLQYFAMPEGRVLNNGGTLSREYTIADQQGNVRVTFDNTGTGGIAKVRQENSYYAFGLIMPGSTVATPTNDNKHLYNGGSEWQNDFGNLPDYYQTFYRSYDAALGRFTGVDPSAGSAESMTGYQYAMNSPMMMNDPLGDKAEFQDYGKADQLGNTTESRMDDWLNTAAGVAAARLDAQYQQSLQNQYWSGVFLKVDNPLGSTGVHYTYDNGQIVSQMPNGFVNNSYSQLDHIIESYDDGLGRRFEVDHLLETQVTGIVINTDNQGKNEGSSQGTSLFGTTFLDENATPSGNSDSFIGRNVLELKTIQYSGRVYDKNKGVLNLNLTRRNGSFDPDVSINVGQFAYGVGIGSNYMSIGGYTIDSGISLKDGVTFGGNYVDKNNHIQGMEFSINPYKIAPVMVGIAYATWPYWVPFLAF
ncbi:DUF6443 domain-containing protein [Mucilaginibacter lappiensis]|uniref:RHS repeat-associated protein n=1 Tax=Mucilaginibacter lappiensis TaxID=354630 RepID=A0A841J7N6_9SPHI|nr:DUF6443 domain-containing protein [Mucilaginibacter lappiensis]MBB6126372.1 RHS repeat-associated protein [Mucilaginibacter lappiensis]